MNFKTLIKVANQFLNSASAKMITSCLAGTNRFSLVEINPIEENDDEETSEIPIDSTHTLYGEKVKIKVYDKGNISDPNTDSILENALMPVSSTVEIVKKIGRYYDCIVQLRGYTK